MSRLLNGQNRCHGRHRASASNQLAAGVQERRIKGEHTATIRLVNAACDAWLAKRGFKPGFFNQRASN